MTEIGRRMKSGAGRGSVRPPYEASLVGLPCSVPAAAGLAGVPPCHGALPVRHRFAVLRLALAGVITGGAMTSIAGR